MILLKPSEKPSTGKKGFVLWEERQSCPVKEHSTPTQVINGMDVLKLLQCMEHVHTVIP